MRTKMGFFFFGLLTAPHPCVAVLAVSVTGLLDLKERKQTFSTVLGALAVASDRLLFSFAKTKNNKKLYSRIT